MRLTTKKLLQVTCIGLLFTGCGKKAAEVTTPAPAQMQAAAPPVDPTSNIDLAQMTRDVRRWILKNQRPPKDFADYAATATTPIPPTPVGKKFAITKEMSVVLVKL